MNIVFVCNEYPPGKVGGIGIFTKKISETLVLSGHSVSVIGLYAGLLSEEFSNENGVRVLKIPEKSGKLGFIENKINIYKALRRFSNENLIDVIECPDFEATLAYIPRIAKKTVCRLHGSHTYFSAERNIKPSFFIQHLERKQLHNVDFLISVSEYTAKTTTELFSLKNKPKVIYNSIDADSFVYKIKEDYSTKKRVIYFGTLVEKKGVYPLAQAWKCFNAKNPDWSLTMVGKNTYEKGLSASEKIKSLLGSAQDSVCFVEHMEHKELIDSLTEYDFAVLPSFSEAFALAPMEAMAVGLPVVVSSMSSGPELIVNNVDGWLCNPGEYKSILSVLFTIAYAEKERERIGGAGLTKVKTRFSFDKFQKENLDFYANILKK